jgi:hypothetical protein
MIRWSWVYWPGDAGGVVVVVALGAMILGGPEGAEFVAGARLIGPLGLGAFGIGAGLGTAGAGCTGGFGLAPGSGVGVTVVVCPDAWRHSANAAVIKRRVSNFIGVYSNPKKSLPGRRR